MTDQPAHMWTYWRDKKGVEDALTRFYPAALSGTAELALALHTIKSNEARIDQIMAERKLAEAQAETTELEAARNRRDIAAAVTNWLPADKKETP